MPDNGRMDELRNTSVIGRLLEEISWEGSNVRDYRAGGRGRENVLTAEVLLPLTYLPRTEFLGEVFRCANGADVVRAQVADELEHADIVLLPDESRLGPDGPVVQLDGVVASQTCHVLIEAKAMRGSFQPEQLPREYLALLRDAGAKVPLLFLVLGSGPPVPVRGYGRLDLEDAVAMHLERVHARTTGMFLQPQELLPYLPSVLPVLVLDPYDQPMPYERITAIPEVMVGVPCVRGTRIPVTTIVGMVAEGMTDADIQGDYPQLSTEDVREALRFAAAAVDERTLPLLPSA